MNDNQMIYGIDDNKMAKITVSQELNGTTIFMIDNSPYEVTRDEKEIVINFLEERGIPLYVKVYKQALKRYISGNLMIDKKFEKTLRKN